MKFLKTLCLTALAAFSIGAFAQEAAIRKNLPERVPNMPAIQEVTKTPFPGVWEVRLAGNRLIYSDDSGNYIFQGALIDTRNRVNLTEQRIEKLTAIAYKDLPLKDSFKIVKGKGTRQMAVFEDPNCGYCKKLHRELANINDITIHVFLIPVLGDDSVDKAERIWCAKDKAKTYLSWMLNNQPPEEATCDTAAIARNSKLASEYGIGGTPTLFFTNNKRVPGFIPADRIEAMLKEAK